MVEKIKSISLKSNKLITTFKKWNIDYFRYSIFLFCVNRSVIVYFIYRIIQKAIERL